MKQKLSQVPESEVTVSATGLDYHYDTYHAVQGVDLTVRRGEIFSLLGTNGAGKTTTLELLQGFRRPTGGSIEVFGVDPARQPGVIRTRTGVVLQESGHFSDITVAGTLRMWASLSSRRDSVDRVLALVELTHRRDTKVDSLSGGERRRLDFAMAIWGSPELVILDEPTTGLDPESRRTLWQIVRELRVQGTTILLTTHYLEEAEQLSERVAIMHRGRIAVHGTIDEVLATRPARITVDVREQDGLLLAASAPPHVEVTWDEVRRPADPRHRVLTATSDDQHESLRWLVNTAEAAGLELGPLRASPASLEEVFHHIRHEPGHDDQAGDDLPGQDRPSENRPSHDDQFVADTTVRS
ncbi:MAG: ABC transporter ATP-binding protein [Actinomycetales bacterium]